MATTGVVEGRVVGAVNEAGVFAEVARRITDAINEGSRLFNVGRSRECAGVYFDIAQWCQGISVLPQDCKTVLQQAARRAEAQFRESGSAEQPAWVMRNALDYTLNVVGKHPTAQGAMPAPAAQNPFLSQGMGGDVRLASSTGGMPSGPSSAVAAPAPGACQPRAYSGYMNDRIGYAAKGACYPGAAYPVGYGSGYRPAEVQKASYPSSYRASAYESRPARVEYAQPARRGYDDGWGGASGALLGGAGGLAVGAMLAGADSGAELAAEGLGGLGGAAIGGAYGGVGGSVVGGVLGALVGDSFF